MNNASLVSIIIPCFNQGMYLSETIESVLSQTYRYWECIIINDGSADNTEEIALGYCNNDERIKYLKQDNKGPCVARNYGISNAGGIYILPLDADDILGKDY